MRVKTGTVRHSKHKKILKFTKGTLMGNRRLIKQAKQIVLHAGEYAFAGRKLKKRDFRKIWIQRINAGLSKLDLSYSRFIDGLKKNKIELNRKMLADLALNHSQVFGKIVEQVKK
ncbi:50S ribosomal protein L20 [Candidatus Beckwithbacteria bacterium]|nr:50S ribosomal protein L20 [Candidatus Beckwithbacteria bacterium]